LTSPALIDALNLGPYAPQGRKKMGDAIHIAIATDRGFAMQAATLISSLVRVHSDDDYVVHILHDGLDRNLQSRIGATSSRSVEIDWIDARSDQYATFGMAPAITAAVLFRLRMAELLSDLDRVIYLDADTIVLTSLRELWEEPLGSDPVAAVRDIGFPYFAGILPWRALGLPPDAPYFNSGVLVISLDRWRELDVGARALELGARHTFRLRDQCALNVVFLDSWHRLPPRWNVQRGHFGLDGPGWVFEGVDAMTVALEQPAVMHFCRPRWNRPWLPECDHPYRDEWFAALASTPWADWVPPQRSRRSRAFAKLKVVRRAVLADPDRSPWA
jgi:lipopolysaccharide biosynthesis glycosyltransferase